MEPAELRAKFPVLERVAYLNAGTCGPLASAAVEAATATLASAASEGRAGAHFKRMLECRTRQRADYAGLLGAEPADVALTTSTGEGIVRVLLGLDLSAGDEVLIAEQEHPGLLGPLAAVRARVRVTVRQVPLPDIADAVTPATRLVACSHVGWVSGLRVPDLRGVDVPVLLDGAQGIGAVPTDVAALGATFYAAAGQKWLCGPIGTGVLWVSPAWRERLQAPGPTHMNLADGGAGLGAVPHADARRHDAAALSPEASALAVAAFAVFAEYGWPAVHARARELASTFAAQLTERGLRVAPRDDTTLVSWEDEDPPATRDRLAAAGVVIRDLPGTPLLRASVGAWNDESDLQRLLSAL